MVMEVKILGLPKISGMADFFRRQKRLIQDDIGKEANRFGNAVIRRAKEHYLTGGGNSRERLNVRTNRLRSSVRFLMENQKGGKELSLQFGSDVPYARIHELGGTTPPRTIVPRKARFLRFMVGRNTVFAKKVNHPGSVIPARPYLSTSINDESPDFFENIRKVIKKSIREKPGRGK